MQGKTVCEFNAWRDLAPRIGMLSPALSAATSRISHVQEVPICVLSVSSYDYAVLPHALMLMLLLTCRSISTSVKLLPITVRLQEGDAVFPSLRAKAPVAFYAATRHATLEGPLVCPFRPERPYGANACAKIPRSGVHSCKFFCLEARTVVSRELFKERWFGVLKYRHRWGPRPFWWKRDA